MKTTEQKNRMIADFMGQLFHNGNTFIPEHNRYIGFKNFSSFFKVSDLRYHESWDWLMPVVEKIESLGFTIEKNFQSVDNDWQCLVVKGNDILFQEFNEQSIQAMHYVVSEFIEMYNNKNK